MQDRIVHKSDELVADFKRYLSEKGKNAATVESYARDSHSFLDFIDKSGVSDGDISAETLDEFRQHLESRGQRENSIRRTVIGVRQLYRFLQIKKGWQNSPMDMASIPKRNDFSEFRLKDGLFTKLVESVGNQPQHDLKRCRDLAILMLLGCEGLKVNEVIELQWKDIFGVSTDIRVNIRGGRARSIQIEAVSALRLHGLREAAQQLLGDEHVRASSFVLPGFKGTDPRAVHHKLTRHGVKFALYEMGNLIGVDHLNSEDLRHHAIAHKLSLGMTPEMVLNHLGLRTLGKVKMHSGG